ncbi:MAG: hypothetical protein II938_01855 [Alphaproteobacteria bacterium]|nr:hypothetical protein [Alphaproteobacteria bacterium]
MRNFIKVLLLGIVVLSSNAWAALYTAEQMEKFARVGDVFRLRSVGIDYTYKRTQTGWTMTVDKNDGKRAKTYRVDSPEPAYNHTMEFGQRVAVGTHGSPVGRFRATTPSWIRDDMTVDIYPDGTVYNASSIDYAYAGRLQWDKKQWIVFSKDNHGYALRDLKDENTNVTVRSVFGEKPGALLEQKNKHGDTGHYVPNADTTIMGETPASVRVFNTPNGANGVADGFHYEADPARYVTIDGKPVYFNEGQSYATVDNVTYQLNDNGTATVYSTVGDVTTQRVAKVNSTYAVTAATGEESQMGFRVGDKMYVGTMDVEKSEVTIEGKTFVRTVDGGGEPIYIDKATGKPVDDALLMSNFQVKVEDGVVLSEHRAGSQASDQTQDSFSFRKVGNEYSIKGDGKEQLSVPVVEPPPPAAAPAAAPVAEQPSPAPAPAAAPAPVVEQPSSAHAPAPALAPVVEQPSSAPAPAAAPAAPTVGSQIDWNAAAATSTSDGKITTYDASVVQGHAGDLAARAESLGMNMPKVGSYSSPETVGVLQDFEGQVRAAEQRAVTQYETATANASKIQTLSERLNGGTYGKVTKDSPYVEAVAQAIINARTALQAANDAAGDSKFNSAYGKAERQVQDAIRLTERAQELTDAVGKIGLFNERVAAMGLSDKFKYTVETSPDDLRSPNRILNMARSLEGNPLNGFGALGDNNQATLAGNAGEIVGFKVVNEEKGYKEYLVSTENGNTYETGFVGIKSGNGGEDPLIGVFKTDGKGTLNTDNIHFTQDANGKYLATVGGSDSQDNLSMWNTLMGVMPGNEARKATTTIENPFTQEVTDGNGGSGALTIAHVDPKDAARFANVFEMKLDEHGQPVAQDPNNTLTMDAAKAYFGVKEDLATAAKNRDPLMQAIERQQQEIAAAKASGNESQVPGLEKTLQDFQGQLANGAAAGNKAIAAGQALLTRASNRTTDFMGGLSNYFASKNVSTAAQNYISQALSTGKLNPSTVGADGSAGTIFRDMALGDYKRAAMKIDGLTTEDLQNIHSLDSFGAVDNYLTTVKNEDRTLYGSNGINDDQLQAVLNSRNQYENNATEATSAWNGLQPDERAAGIGIGDQAATGQNMIKEGEAAGGVPEADVVTPQTQLGGVGADLTDLLRMALVIALPLVHQDDLTIQEQMDVAANKGVSAIGPAEGSALETEAEDASRATTIVSGADLVSRLLQAATVDVSLLSEEVKFEELPTNDPKIEGAAISSTSGQQEGYRSNPTTSSDDDDDIEEESDGRAEAIVLEIKRRRAELMKQYVNAGIQIAEGMNAISSEFGDRANVLKTVSDSVGTETQAFVLNQDAARYVLFETLRGLALTSTQMGVQASRLLFEQSIF